MEKVNAVEKIEPSDHILVFKSRENPVYIKYFTFQPKCRGVQSLFSQNKNKYSLKCMDSSFRTTLPRLKIDFC